MATLMDIRNRTYSKCVAPTHRPRSGFATAGRYERNVRQEYQTADDLVRARERRLLELHDLAGEMPSRGCGVSF